MTKRLCFSSVATLLVICSPAYAQHRVAGGMAFAPSARAGVVRMLAPARQPGVTVVHVPPRGRGIDQVIDGSGRRTGTTQVITTPGSTTTSGVTVINGFPGVSVQDLLNPVPGLGFDFTHLAAINRDLDVRALIDPVTQLRLALAERLLRETPAVFGVAPFFAEPAPFITESPQSQAPPVIVVQQPTAEQAAPAVQREPQPRPEPASAAPLPESGEFVLVRHNGSVVFAVAFSQQGDRIVYVTREGTRRWLSVNDLDADATERMNEERGNNVQLSR